MSLQGTLRTLGITEVLEFLADRNATGRLSIEADSGAATYMMSDGEVLSAQYAFDHEAGADAAEATYYALAELDGTFLFTEEDVEVEDDSTESIPDLLGRTADAAEAWSTVEDVIPTRDHELTRRTTFTDSVTVEPEWWTAIDAIGSGSSSRVLTDALGMRALAASLMAADMTRAGILVVGEPASSIAKVVEIDTPVEPEITAEAGAEPFAMADPELPEHHAGAETEYVAEAPVAHDDPITNMFADHSAPVVESPEALIESQDVVASTEPAVAAQELEAAMTELEALASDSAFFDEPASTDHFADASAPSQFEPTAFDATPDFTADAPAPDVFDQPVASEDGWASDHGVASTPAPSTPTPAPSTPALSTPSPFTPEPATADSGVWGDVTDMPSPQPEDPFSSPSSTPMFGGLPGPDATDTAQEHSNLAYLNAPEPTMPTVPDTSRKDALVEGVDDEFATEDRSSVLKFLRRD